MSNTERTSKPELPRRRLNWWKLLLFPVSLFVFILAMLLMREGAAGLSPLVRNHFDVSNPLNSLGFGWLFAYAVLSGSPVAAAALTFLDVGLLNGLSTLTMITGSRLGASFIVLFIGFLYVLRGRDWANSLGIGLLSLTVTGTINLIALLPGLFLLRWELLHWVDQPSSRVVAGLNGSVFEPLVERAALWLPGWALFPVGLLIIMASFKLFDFCLPQVSLKRSQIGRLANFVYRPWIMFLLGAFVTLISMSVSVSLGILLPLSERGFIRRENIVPYIMGANITTFVDTLLAAILLDNQLAFTVVMVQMVSVSLVAAFILLAIFYIYERAMLFSIAWLTAKNSRLTLFVVLIVMVPLGLMLI